MWHWTHLTREWGEFWYAVYSGRMTVWQTVPQNFGESMKLSAAAVLVDRTIAFTTVRNKITRATRRTWGSLKSNFG